MNLTEEVEAVKKTFQQWEGKLGEVEQQRDRLKNQKKELQKKIEKEVEQGKRLAKAEEVMKKVIDVLFTEALENYKSLVTKALNDVFSGKEYEFDIELDSRGSNKTAEMRFREKKSGEWEPWRDLDTACGGSLRAIVDLITRVFLIAKTDRRRFVVFDESLSEIADEYIDNVVALLEELSDKMGFDFLFVTHDNRYVEKMDTVYEMDNGRVEEL